MIRLNRSLIAGLQEANPQVVSIRKALQSAIELEHATIPVYLYGLYSLNPAKNAAIVNIIQSVVVEEMLHMTLAANVLNALGGTPIIDKPHFIPNYPGTLPGGVESGLIVNLNPFSADQLATYLQIEQPENPIEVPGEEPPSDDGMTIGEFYQTISKAISTLPASDFPNPPRNQIGLDLMGGAVNVTDAESAQAAIQIIVDQGEGSAVSPEESSGSDDPAHYYRFMQIYAGAMLEPAPGKTPPWSYSGAPVIFDAEGVYPVPNNPHAKDYPVGSAQAFANDNFNYTYTSLLKALHQLFNGQNNQTQMNTVIGLMMSLKGQAKAMMAGIPNPSAPNTGPSFQYQPVNPGAMG